jgi:hypothetical protein
MAIATEIIRGIETIANYTGVNKVAAPAVAIFALMVGFSYFIFHQITYKEEKGYLNKQMLNKQKTVYAPELESVESSQERRSKKEREEEQSIEDVDSDSDSDSEEEERPTKRPRLTGPTVAELVLEQLEEYNQRVHLITFAATDAEAAFILKYVPRARYLVSLDAEENHDHITEVRYARMRCNSAPAEIA